MLQKKSLTSPTPLQRTSDLKKVNKARSQPKMTSRTKASKFKIKLRKKQTRAKLVYPKKLNPYKTRL